MKLLNLYQYFLVALGCFVLSISPAGAHLMVAQKGTINIDKGAAFVVISLPLSAFSGVDENGDGILSDAEFESNRTRLAAQVATGFTLIDAAGEQALQDLMLSPSHTHQASASGTNQVVALGRFPMADPDTAFRLVFTLFGTRHDEQTQQISVTRQADSRKQFLQLSPAANSVVVIAAET